MFILQELNRGDQFFGPFKTYEEAKETRDDYCKKIFTDWSDDTDFDEIYQIRELQEFPKYEDHSDNWSKEQWSEFLSEK